MDRQLEKWFGILFLGLVAVAGLNAAEPDTDIESVLRNWEATSGDRGRDGVMVRVLQPALGPVRVEDLLKRFTWSRISPSEVEAVPRDRIEQQFLPNVRVTLNEMGLPQTVAIGDFRQRIRDVVRAEMSKVAAREAINPENGIVRVSFDSEGSLAGNPVIAARVNEILTRWVATSRTANAVRASFQRADYDSATEVESHSTGVFVFSAPYSGLYHAQPVTSFDGDSARVGLDGKPYARLPGQEMMLIWNNNQLTQVDTAAQRYEVHQLPTTAKDLLGGGSFDTLWQSLIAPQSSIPLVVALQEKELRSNYQWSLVLDNQKAIILHGVAIAGADAMLYQSAQIVIDPATFRTQATRMFDITGTKETVHEFQIQVAAEDVAALNGWQPDLSEYDRFGDIPGVEPAAFTEVAPVDLPPAPPATLPEAE